MRKKDKDKLTLKDIIVRQWVERQVEKEDLQRWANRKDYIDEINEKIKKGFYKERSEDGK